MHLSLLGLLCCPDDGSHPLELRAEAGGLGDGEVGTGELACAACGRAFPIRDGIPVLLPKSISPVPREHPRRDRVARDKLSEMRTRDRRAWVWGDSGYQDALEIPATLAALEPGAADRVLDAGCGTGRMVEHYAPRCREVVAVDFSFHSLLAARERCAHLGANLHLAQADVCHMPFLARAFDRALSSQVLQHLPHDGQQRRAVAELARVLKPGGRCCVSAYNHSLRKRLRHLLRRPDCAKQGYHWGDAIYYYNFTAPEIRALLGAHFRLHRLKGIGRQLPLRRLGRLGLHIESSLQRLPVSLLTGDLLLAVCSLPPRCRPPRGSPGGTRRPSSS